MLVQKLLVNFLHPLFNYTIVLAGYQCLTLG